mgnify:FL=1
MIFDDSNDDDQQKLGQRWLGNTPLLDIHHPRIRLLAVRLTQLKYGQRAKAQACFEYVRALPFGCIGTGTGVPALVVLQLKRGDCHTKSTLLVALLRSLDIPARLRFVSLHADFLQGIIDLGDQPVEHCCVEVLLDGRWRAIDSHVMDLSLAEASRQRLLDESRSVGYGMHVRGSVDWDGDSDSFTPFVTDDPQHMPLKDWGVFDDPYQFYSSEPAVRGKLNWASRMKWMLGARMVNQRVNELRSAAVASGR